MARTHDDALAWGVPPHGRVMAVAGVLRVAHHEPALREPAHDVIAVPAFHFPEVVLRIVGPVGVVAEVAVRTIVAVVIAAARAPPFGEPILVGAGVVVIVIVAAVDPVVVAATILRAALMIVTVVVVLLALRDGADDRRGSKDDGCRGGGAIAAPLFAVGVRGDRHILEVAIIGGDANAFLGVA